MAGSGGGGRIATVGAVLGLCLGGASVGTVCVVTDRVPILGPDPPARQAARAEQPKPKMAKRLRPSRPSLCFQWRRPRRARDRGRARPNPRPRQARRRQSRRKRSPRAARSSKRESAEAAPREFGFEQQAPAPEPAATTTQSVAGPTAPTSTDAKRPTAVRRHDKPVPRLRSSAQPSRSSPRDSSAESLRHASRLLPTGFLDARGSAAVRETRVLSARCALSR